MIYRFVAATLACFCLSSASFAAEPTTDHGEWVQLFNGENLDGWIPKIRGHEAGDNYADTFRVEDGLLTVSYDKYQPADFVSVDNPKKKSFNKFGHLFHKDVFSNYILRIEYRFIGEQVLNGPGWALRNNGIMFHGQRPETMAVDQDFPVSFEAQLLGGNGRNDRPTLNLCTPGTTVVLGDALLQKHCTSSVSETYHGDGWVTAEIEVHGSKLARHTIDGKTVLEYTDLKYDPAHSDAQKLIVDGNLRIEEGTISIQSESHPTQFRKIELKKLDGPVVD